ncbi:MAG: 1-deoxy-D-xylulose-5-phosphate reductoisomerase [Clostridia bacterium]|nr:1-deoxy-D-xylulose-5-phosphate reductoisomerase [Clostridia bacterium]
MTDRTITVLGATGSVGLQACDVAEETGLKVKMLCAGRNAKVMAEQARRLHPEVCIMEDETAATELCGLLAGEDVKIYGGREAISDFLLSDPADVTIHSIAGLAGLETAIAASSTPTRIGMANKEAVIAAGPVIRDLLRESGGTMIPVDSEHSAIFQCLTTEGEPRLFERCDRVSRIILTASGGPFFGMKRDELDSVTPERALAHPTWKMGPKITIDCATLMNKGFEVIEAARFFGVSSEKIDVVIHRQSIIHSMVEYIDNNVIAQMGLPDMRSAVRYAVNYPERLAAPVGRVDFTKIGSLTFHEPDNETFPLLSAARNALIAGGTAPAALIAADEEAVQAFIDGKLSFCGIADAVCAVMDRVNVFEEITLESLAETDLLARKTAQSVIGGMTL